MWRQHTGSFRKFGLGVCAFGSIVLAALGIMSFFGATAATEENSVWFFILLGLLLGLSGVVAQLIGLLISLVDVLAWNSKFKI